MEIFIKQLPIPQTSHMAVPTWAHLHLPKPPTFDSKRKDSLYSFQWMGKWQQITISCRSIRSLCSRFSNTRLLDNFLDTEQGRREEEGVFICFHQFLMSAGHFRSWYCVGNQTLTMSTALCGLEIAMPLGTIPMLYRVTHVFYPVFRRSHDLIHPQQVTSIYDQTPSPITGSLSSLQLFIPVICHLTLTITLFNLFSSFSLYHTTVMYVIILLCPHSHCLCTCPAYLSHFMSSSSSKCLSCKLIPIHKLLSLKQTLQQYHHHVQTVLYVEIFIHYQVSDIT